MRLRSAEAIGITIGNAQARAAVWEAGQAHLIPLEDGEPVMPSAVLLHRLREVGKYAYLYSGTDPQLLVTSINRLLGRKYRQLADEIARLSCQISAEGERARIVDWLGKFYSPIDLYAMLLRKLRFAAERYLGRSVDRAVIAVTGGFDDFQRRSVRSAAESVFIESKLINEPAAAVLAMDELLPARGRLLSFDMGAGKCEAAIIAKDRRVRIEAIAGDTHLGGDDIDHLIFTHIAEDFRRAKGEAMIGDSAMARHEVLLAVRAAKHLLSQEQEASVSVPFVNFDSFGRPMHLHTNITRAQLEHLCSDLLTRAAKVIRAAMEDSGNRIVGALCLGGSTRLPFIKNMVARITGQPLIESDNPDELAALGAAVYAAQWQEGDLAVEDVTAHSLGITTWSGDMGFILKRQSAIPAEVTKRFVTVEDNQKEVHIEVREGEDRRAKSNSIIGEFYLPLPKKLPKHSPIDVTIGKDEDGLVRVCALDLSTKTVREITITYDL